jgi:hypothetical protein
MPFTSRLIRRQALENKSIYSLVLIVLAVISGLSIFILGLPAKALTVYTKAA